MFSARAIFQVLCALFALAASAVAANAATLSGVRFGVPEPGVSRLVFDLEGEAAYAISGEEVGKGRLIVDFTGLNVPQAERGIRPGQGVFARYEATSSPGAARVVLEFARTVRIKQHFLLPAKAPGEKTRLVVDFVGADMQGFLASLPEQPKKYEDMADVIRAVTASPTSAVAAAPSKPTLAADVPIVVIDAGHGGGDPGAVGSGGTQEKTVTLAAAVELAEQLKKRGRYKVVLTRAGDQRIRPEERTEIARAAGADLFISLHADAHPDAKVRGASVYTISEEGTARSTREAMSQEDLKVYDLNIKEFDPGLGRTFLDLAQDKTVSESAEFARILVSELSGATTLINNTHRTADLRVLLSPDVAAVLLELAFISNAADEANLKTPAWRVKTMTAVADAIDAYFDSRDLARHAANSARGSR